MIVMMATRNYLASTVSALIVIFLGGCATLPDGDNFAHRAPAGAPTIVSAKGVLSPAQSRAIINRLQAAPRPTDLLQRHGAVVEMLGGRRYAVVLGPEFGREMEEMFEDDLAASERIRWEKVNESLPAEPGAPGPHVLPPDVTGRVVPAK